MKDYGDHSNERSLKRQIYALPKPFIPHLRIQMKQYKGFLILCNAWFSCHQMSYTGFAIGSWAVDTDDWL